MDQRVLIAVFVLCNAVCFGHNSNDVLHQTLIFFRHGDRAPLETYVNDPHKNFQWNGGLGGLTLEGQTRMKELGQWLRREYGHIINYTYTPENTRVISSDFDRCVASCKFLLSGLYPDPDGNSSLSETIPIVHNERIMKKIMVLSGTCPRLIDDFQKANTYEQENRSDERRQLFQRISYYTGRRMKTLSELAILYSTLVAQRSAGLQLPAWANNATMESLRQLNGESLAFFTHNTLSKRLRAGPFLTRVISYMQSYTRGWNSIKMHLFGVHDVNLINLFRAMDIPPYKGERLAPYYGGMLAFELWKSKNTNRYYVEVRYMDDSKLERSDKLSIPLCGETCYLDEMMHTFREVIPVNWDEECKLTE